MSSGALNLVRLATSESSERSPVLFVHGFMGSARDWSEVAKCLSRVTGRSMWAVDLPGHGQSTGLSQAVYSFEEATVALQDTIHKAGIASVVLAGYSLGGRVAMATAVRIPEMVCGLVLESAHPGFEDPGRRAGRLERDLDTSRRLREDWPAFLDDWYLQSVFASLTERPGLRNAWIRCRAENDPDELARALSGCSTGRQRPLTPLLDTIGVPIQYLAGELDRKYVEIGRRTTARVERMSFRVVGNAGHNVHAEQPGAYLQVVQSFLSNLEQ